MIQSYASEKPWLKGEKRSSAAGLGFGEVSDKTVICQTPAVSRGKEGAPHWGNTFCPFREDVWVFRAAFPVTPAVYRPSNLYMPEALTNGHKS